jgi:putative DNA primase/helicase
MTLLDHHEKMLSVGSAISPEIIKARGYKSVTAIEARQYGFTGQQARDGLLLPVRPPDGSNGLYVLRPDTPRSEDDKKKGKLPDGTFAQKVWRYEWPKGIGLRVDVSPTCLQMIKDVSKPVIVTEGIKKADSLASHLSDYCILDLNGVWSYKNQEGILADFDCMNWVGRIVFIIYDSDIVAKKSVAKAIARLSKVLEHRKAKVTPIFLPPGPNGEKQGVDDFFAQGGTVEELFFYAKLGEILPYKLGAKGDPLPQSAEYLEVLHSLGYTFTMDDITDGILVNGQPITDPLEAEIKTRMRDLGYKQVNVIADAYLAWAHHHRIHSVKDYLNGLKWDGQGHIAQLSDYFIDDHAAEYEAIYPDSVCFGGEVFTLWLTRWLIGAVAKVLGRQQNAMLVLDGPQGCGKSYFVNWLGGVLPDHFIEAAINPDDKDVWLRLMSKFVWEVGELGSTTRRADRDSLKNFISTRIVTVRKSYGKHDTVKPALANLIGTINNEAGFLSDPTGNRRFLVCRLSEINWQYTATIDPHQVWAEAVHLYQQGERWRLNAEETRLQQLINDGYMVETPLNGLLLRHYDVNPKSETWIPAITIVTHLESVGLKGYQIANLKDLAITMDNLKVEKKRVGKAKTVCYRGITKRETPRSDTAFIDDDPEHTEII